MPRVAEGLTAKQVAAAKFKEQAYKLFDGRGLYLEVSPRRAKYWRFKYRFGGKEKLISLGVFGDGADGVSLAKARERCEQARAQVKSGIDPSAVRKQEKVEQRLRSESSFELVARDWLQTKVEAWTPDHRQGVLASMQTNLFPRLGALPIAEITEAHVRECIKAIEHRQALDVAARSLQRCTRIIQHAVQMGLRTGNPARELRGIVRTRAVTHRAAFPIAEIPEFLRRLAQYQGRPETRLGLRLLLLTSVRPGELRFARWDEFDLAAKTWRIPAARMKMREEHVVPLAEQAMAVLEELRPITGRSEFLFPSVSDLTKPISENTLLYAMYRMGYHNRATSHGFRSIFSTWANEQGFRADVIERQLAHRERNKVRAAYNRALYLPERRKLLQVWADHLDTATEDRNVVAGSFGRAA